MGISSSIFSSQRTTFLQKQSTWGVRASIGHVHWLMFNDLLLLMTSRPCNSPVLSNLLTDTPPTALLLHCLLHSVDFFIHCGPIHSIHCKFIFFLMSVT